MSFMQQAIQRHVSLGTYLLFIWLTQLSASNWYKAHIEKCCKKAPTKICNETFNVQQFSIVIPLIQYNDDNIPQVDNLTNEMEAQFPDEKQEEQDQESDKEEEAAEEIEEPTIDGDVLERFLSKMLPDNLLNKKVL